MPAITKILLTLVLTLCLCTAPLFAFADTVCGDVDGDGILSSSDARIILRMSVGLEDITEELFSVADINSDGVISSEDARLSLRLSIGIYDAGTSAAFNDNNSHEHTQNNFNIYEIDGITYIDGIIIANKSYSLPESYNPGGLLPECTDAFTAMQKDARSKGLSIYISSGFRSYESQKNIYNRYVRQDGQRLADTYSARPGHSEHQTGLAIDLNTITQAFARTAEGKWVAAHCHEYGFIIRYPQGKEQITGYSYEPWHLRYVGIEKATAIYESGLCLEEYFGITSKYK